MRTAVVVVGATLLTLSGCAMFDRSSPSENVQTAYAGTSSMSARQIAMLLHEKGYTDVSDLHKNGNDWLGAATNSTGMHVDFDIDKGGVIHEK